MNHNGEIDGNSIRRRLDRWLLVVCPTLIILTFLVTAISGRVNSVRTSGNAGSPTTPAEYHIGFSAHNLSPRRN